MTYIITAKVYLNDEVNRSGERDKMQAKVLSEREGNITFRVPGEFGEEQTHTRVLCGSLIDAGFVAFDIGHSF
jgi:hypothetical protein